MQYDFNKSIERVGTHSMKWDSDSAYAQGSVLPMWVADMDFECPAPLVKAVRARAEHPVFGYAHLPAEFAGVTAGWVSRRHGWAIENDWVSFSPGVVPSISAVIQTMTEPGEKVLIQPPVYYPFRNTIEGCGREVAASPLVRRQNRYEMDFEDLERKAADPAVRLMLLCNPHNPVARVYTREELLRVGEICRKYGVFVFSDEIHADFVMSGHRHIPFASLSAEFSQNAATAISPSKTFNMAGLQASCMITENEEVREKFQRQLKKNVQDMISNFGLAAYLAAFSQCDDYCDQLRAYIEGNVRFVSETVRARIPQLGVLEHEGTYLLWLDCRALGLSPESLDRFFWEEAGLSLDSGHWFGREGDGYMRLNLACPRKTVEEALIRLEKAVSRRFVPAHV